MINLLLLINKKLILINTNNNY